MINLPVDRIRLLYKMLLYGVKAVTDTNIIVFSLTRLWLEPTIYSTRGEHENHYTTSAIMHFMFQHVLCVAHKLLLDFQIFSNVVPTERWNLNIRN